MIVTIKKKRRMFQDNSLSLSKENMSYQLKQYWPT